MWVIERLGERLLCATCHTEFKVDLGKIARAKTYEYCLVNKTTPCKIYGCPGEISFWVASGRGKLFFILTDKGLAGGERIGSWQTAFKH